MKLFPSKFRRWITCVTLLCLSVPTVALADAFSWMGKAAGISLQIVQSYDDDGSSNAFVALNGAKLRAFSDMQRLSIKFDKTTPDGERIVVLHHWLGGNGCAGALSLFSLSDRGFFQSSSMKICVENFSVELNNDDPNEVIIKAYTDTSRTSILDSWVYLEGEVLRR